MIMLLSSLRNSLLVSYPFPNHEYISFFNNAEFYCFVRLQYLRDSDIASVTTLMELLVEAR
jgi:hypothetical protein